VTLRSEHAIKLAVYFVLAAISAFMVFPFVWMVV
jgi:hypothetical protein